MAICAQIPPIIISNQVDLLLMRRVGLYWQSKLVQAQVLPRIRQYLVKHQATTECNHRVSL